MSPTPAPVKDETQPQFMLMANRDLAMVILLGAIVGLLTWGLSWLLSTYVFSAILCGDGDTRCASVGMYGEIGLSQTRHPCQAEHLIVLLERHPESLGLPEHPQGLEGGWHLRSKAGAWPLKLRH